MASVNYTDPKRGHPLVFRGDAPDVPALTCELYEKWYTLWLVMPDGSVQDALPDDTVAEAWALTSGTFAGDHCWNPKVLRKLACAHGWVIDSLSFELIVGRWVCDYEERY